MEETLSRDDIQGILALQVICTIHVPYPDMFTCRRSERILERLARAATLPGNAWSPELRLGAVAEKCCKTTCILGKLARPTVD